MEETELMTLVSQTSQLMEQFERRCAALDERSLHASQAFDALTRDMPDVVQRSADGALSSLPPQVMARLREGLDRSVADYARRLDEAARCVGEASRGLSRQMSRSEHLHRALLWKVAAVSGLSFTLLLAAAIWLSSHYMAVIEANQVSADLLRAYNAADVVLCGEGRLCANVNPKGHKVGARGQYLPVNPR